MTRVRDRIAMFDVGTGFLKEALHMPTSTKIVGAVIVGSASGPPVLRLTVMDDALPLVHYSEIPMLQPTVTRHEWDWNVREDSDS